MNPLDFTAATGPTKVQRMLDAAARHGLSVTYDGQPNGDLTSSYAWTIKSGAGHDRDALWLFWRPGPNGGSLGIDYYRPDYVTGKSNTKRVTRRQAHQQMQWMREILERHQERQAKPAVVTNGSDLSPGMKMTLRRGTPHEPRLSTKTTINALVARGLAVDMGGGFCCLTDQGRKVRAALAADAAWQAATETLDEPLAACGCPERAIQEDGHREGCALHGADLARLARIRADAEAAGDEALAVQITRERIAMAKNTPASPWQYPANPQDPGWLRADQVVHRAGEVLTVVAVIIHQGVLRSVAVTVNGGYGGKLRWYGDYAEPTHGPVSLLFDDLCGLPADERRPWPHSLVSAQETVRRILGEQRLDGWVLGKLYDEKHGGGYIVVQVPARKDPARHLALLERYVPYVCNVRLLGDSEGWTEIAIEPTDAPED